MKALEFKEQNAFFAKDQPEYNTLPCHKVDEPEGRVIFCMGLSFPERLRVLLTGKIWVSLMTFNNPLTPSHFTTKKTDYFNDKSYFTIFYLRSIPIWKFRSTRKTNQAKEPVKNAGKQRGSEVLERTKRHVRHV